MNKDLSDYYSSPAWQQKRSERLKIDDYRCQKCGFTRALEVHHINYERFGNEDVSRDLITLCKKCHNEIESQKKHINPLPVSKEHHKVYLAGKISKYGWRTFICKNYRNIDIREVGSDYEYKENDELTITGPFFIPCDHGCYHGKGSHGVGVDMHEGHYIGGCMGAPFTRHDVVNICKQQIDNAEIVYAYIDSDDCYGTLAELGYASAKNKLIVIDFQDGVLEEAMWFVKYLEKNNHSGYSYEWLFNNILGPIERYEDELFEMLGELENDNL